MTDLDKHFSELSIDQLKKFNSLIELYRFWNSKVNLISRKDIDNLYVNHILHSLSIAKITGLDFFYKKNGLMNEIEESLNEFSMLNDPNGIYMKCFCELD